MYKKRTDAVIAIAAPSRIFNKRKTLRFIYLYPPPIEHIFRRASSEMVPGLRSESAFISEPSCRRCLNFFHYTLQRDWNPLNTALFAHWQRQWNSLAPESSGAFSDAYPVSNTEQCKRNYHRKCREKYAPIIPAKKQYHGQEQHDKP